MRTNAYYGAIDVDGNIIIPLIYDLASQQDGFVSAQLDGITYGINLNGEIVFSLTNLWALGYGGKRLVVGEFKSTNERVGIYDYEGNAITPLVYEDLNPYIEGLAGAKLDGRWGFVDVNGATVVPYRYDAVGNFDHGFAVVIANERRGLVDRTGREVFAPVFEDIYFPLNIESSDGLFAIKTNGLWGFAHTNGTTPILARYKDVSDFHDGVTSVRLEGEWVTIDREGNVVP